NSHRTILARAPRLAATLPAMATCVADTLGISVDATSIKAKSPEGLGLLGRREGMAGMAVVSGEGAVRLRLDEGLQHADAQQGGARSPHAGNDPDVLVRRDGVRPVPRRPRADD